MDQSGRRLCSERSGLADSVRVVAFDSNVVSVDMLETGEVDALIVQNPYAMGYLGVENAYRLLGGHDLDEREVNTSTHLVTKEKICTVKNLRECYFPLMRFAENSIFEPFLIFYCIFLYRQECYTQCK